MIRKYLQKPTVAIPLAVIAIGLALWSALTPAKKNAYPVDSSSSTAITTSTPEIQAAAPQVPAQPRLPRDLDDWILCRDNPFVPGKGCGMASVPQPSTPTKPVIVKSVPLTKIVVNGIVIAPNGRVALINGKTYKVGDRIQNHRILSIDSTGIQFSHPVKGPTLIPLSRGSFL